MAKLKARKEAEMKKKIEKPKSGAGQSAPEANSGSSKILFEDSSMAPALPFCDPERELTAVTSKPEFITQLSSPKPSAQSAEQDNPTNGSKDEPQTRQERGYGEDNQKSWSMEGATLITKAEEQPCWSEVGFMESSLCSQAYKPAVAQPTGEVPPAYSSTQSNLQLHPFESMPEVMKRLPTPAPELPQFQNETTSVSNVIHQQAFMPPCKGGKCLNCKFFIVDYDIVYL